MITVYLNQFLFALFVICTIDINTAIARFTVFFFSFFFFCLAFKNKMVLQFSQRISDDFNNYDGCKYYIIVF